jgi:hypothetical protein
MTVLLIGKTDRYRAAIAKEALQTIQNSFRRIRYGICFRFAVRRTPVGENLTFIIQVPLYIMLEKNKYTVIYNTSENELQSTGRSGGSIVTAIKS